MSKRLAIISFIVLGSIIFGIAGFCLVLFLAPGLTVFGVKFIKHDMHKVWTHKYAILDTYDFKGASEFGGNLVIETSEVPINIIYSQDFEYYFEYYDNYDGFTTSDIDDPSISVKKDEATNSCVIKVSEYKRFVYESSSSERYLNIYIPIIDVSDGYYRTTNLTITTDSAPITFSREKEGARVVGHKNLTINTKSGRVNYDINIHADQFNYTTNNSIKIYGDEHKDIFSTNYDLESKNGKITIYNGVVGDVVAKTKNGDISLKSCKNLIVETNYGDVKSSEKDMRVEVRGIVNIKTKSGKVTLGKVLGNGENKIETGGGKVSITSMKDGTVTTKRGSITIDSVRSAKIKSNVGKVTIEEVLSNINVETKRGNIVLGGSGMTVKNPTVYSRIGKVDMKSASGVVRVETVNSNINFTNTDSTDIRIVCGKKLNADRLTGSVYISSQGNVELTFMNITDKATIELGDKCYSAVIYAENDTKEDTKYYFEGESVQRFEDNAVLDDDTVVKNEKNDALVTDAYISVIGKNAEILAYFKKP